MKFIVYFSIQLVTTSILGQGHSLDSFKQYIAKDLSNWVSSFSAFSFSDFKKSDTVKFENNYPQSFKELKSFYSIYKPLLTFSKDSSRFIDIYSYQLNLEKKGDVYVANPDIDQAILLCNLRTKYWDRIFFGGMLRWIDDAIFISNSKFILVGIDKNKNNERVPMIIVGDIPKQTLEIFINTNKSCIQLGNGYESPKLKKLPITGL